MDVKSILNIWSNACDCTGIKWYLFKETLLCAVGYNKFPDYLTVPQVACLDSDFKIIVKRVLPLLPKAWRLDKSNFGRGEHILVFKQGSQPVLELCILLGFETLEQVETFIDKTKNIVSKINKIRSWNEMASRFTLYKKTMGVVIKYIDSNVTQSNFNKILDLLSEDESKICFYSDVLTNKNPVVINEENFSNELKVCCDGIYYPVFEGYDNYLNDVYGDYKIGLYDEIGCGVTGYEKIELKKHQDRCMQVLAFIEEISTEYGLHYYLLAGSVLGAVRHGGFIPWDDDIDIGIRTEEIEFFEDVIKREIELRLPKGFELMQAKANEPYPRMFSKICFEGRCCIDLWPLVPTYDSGLRSKLLWRFAKVMTKVHYVKIGHRVNRFRKIAELIGMFTTDNVVMYLARKNERLYGNKLDTSYINLYSIYSRNKETIRRKWLDTEARVLFNGMLVPVIGCTEEYLTNLYGDYMKKPAPWKRISRHVARFDSQHD